jgi:acyl-CoA thioester hydrolase
MTLLRTKFETEMQVRPDDIDMFQHVHSSRYLDYLLAARFDQMERFYVMPMQEFLKLGLGWVVTTSHLEYKRPLCLAERFTVRTWIEDMRATEVEVRFEMMRETGKAACLGWCSFAMVKLDTGRAETIPDWIRKKYAI